MSEDQFTKLYKYMQMEFSKLHEEIDQRFGEVHDRLSQVYDLVDNDFNRRDTDELERVAMSSQLVILKDYKDTTENKAVAKVFDDVAKIEDCIEFDYNKRSIEKALL